MNSICYFSLSLFIGGLIANATVFSARYLVPAARRRDPTGWVFCVNYGGCVDTINGVVPGAVLLLFYFFASSDLTPIPYVFYLSRFVVLN